MILQVALPLPFRKLFDYYLPEKESSASFRPGMRVKVPFGSRNLIGIFIETVDHSLWPSDKIKSIIEWVDQEPVFPPSLLNLCQWAARYYHYPLGEILFHALPTLLRSEHLPEFKKQRKTNGSKISRVMFSTSESIILNAAQKNAVVAITRSLDNFSCFLLDGITGSGKTEVYLSSIQAVLAQNKQALVLVPEIALTPQTISRFQERFNALTVCLHSNLNKTEQLNTWLQIKHNQAKIIIGTRSALFAPCPQLGMIVVDEEHDPSFKQQKSFRYSARDLAMTRAKLENIPIVLGSATPALETLYNIKSKNIIRLTLPERPGQAVHPSYHFINLCHQKLEHGLSSQLIERMEFHLNQKNQVLLFLNRRGYAPVLMCHYCGWIADCPHCDVHLTLHQQPKHLRCHYCNFSQLIPSVCPRCRQPHLHSLGTGTERLEIALREKFPAIPIFRIDRDSTRRKHAFTQLLDKIQQGQQQILIGTQMIAKGHHFPNVTLVGVVNADAGFFSADFRAIERAGQLLVQVAGRAGRAEKAGEVWIQTYHPEHPFLQQLTQEGYLRFATSLLLERKESLLPPYAHLALMRAESVHAISSENFLTTVNTLAESLKPDPVMLLGPIPSPRAKQKGRYHFQLLFQSPSRHALQRLLDQLIPRLEQIKPIRSVKWSLDIDPIEMIE